MNIPPLVLNILILAAVAFFAFRGWRQGLLYALCSLAAGLAAIFGAYLCARALAPAVAQWIEPGFSKALGEALTQNPELSQAGLPTLFGAAGLSEHLGTLLQAVLPQETVGAVVTQAVAKPATEMLAFVGVFLAAFLLLSLIWRIVSGALRLVNRLPVVGACNQILGGVFGFLKGLLVVGVIGWALCDLTGLISNQTLADTWLLQGLSQVFEPILLKGTQVVLP